MNLEIKQERGPGSIEVNIVTNDGARININKLVRDVSICVEDGLLVPHVHLFDPSFLARLSFSECNPDLLEQLAPIAAEWNRRFQKYLLSLRAKAGSPLR